MSLISSIKEEQVNQKKIEITVSGGIAPYKFLFYKESGHLLREDDFSLSTIIISEGGKYYCTVLDNKNCYKTIEFELK